MVHSGSHLDKLENLLDFATVTVIEGRIQVSFHCLVWFRGIARMITLLPIMVGWIFFRTERFDGAMAILSSMVNLTSVLHGNLGPS